MPLTITDSKTGAADLLEPKKPIRPVGKGGVETNEVDRNSMGGTELMKYGLHERLPKELLEQFQIICSRVRDIDPKRIPVYWCHDLAGDTEVAISYINVSSGLQAVKAKLNQLQVEPGLIKVPLVGAFV